MFLEFCLVILVLLLIKAYKWATKGYDIFEKRGIPFTKPVPLLGNTKDVILRRASLFDVVVTNYQKFNAKVFGVFEQRQALFVVKDPYILKQITVKDFDHFVNHRTFSDDTEEIGIENDESNLFGNSLFFMKDNKWKDMRHTLSPAFTGSKMRQMFSLINKVFQDTMEYLKELPDIDQGVELDIKDYTTRVTNDIIASTAFGITVNSLKDRENEFYEMGKKVTSFTPWQTIKLLLSASFKPVFDFFKIEAVDGGSNKYFFKIVIDAMKYRQEHKIVRPDMINMLMEARGLIASDNTKVREWTDTEIVSQCFLFFFAGFETASTLMCFAAHELMENPEIQNRLYEEIKEVSDNLNGEPVTYEALQSMKYMDMIVSETLRKWPPSVAMDRRCNKDIVYEVDGERIELKKGDNIWIPAAGFHRDPKYFPNPSVFDPERFSDERKNEIIPFTYMPFGLGPRNCIGSRFGMLEAKAQLFYLVRDFKITAGKKTSIPLTLANSGFQLIPVNGFWLKLTRRA